MEKRRIGYRRRRERRRKGKREKWSNESENLSKIVIFDNFFV